MTESNSAPATAATAFAFARQLRDPQLRARLREMGWISGMDVVPTSDAETISSLAKRIAIDASGKICLIVWESASEPSGFAVMFVESVPQAITRLKRLWPSQRRPETISIQATTSVGMVYAHLKGCPDYMPSGWVRPVRFMEKVS